MIAAEVSTALTLLTKKAEYMAATGPDVRAVVVVDGGGGGSMGGGRAVGSAANAAQLRNIALCSQLQEVHRSLVGLLPRLAVSAAGALSEALSAVQAAAVEAVTPIFKAEVEALEDRILRMHALSYGGDSVDAAEAGAGNAAAAPPSAMVNTSAYILECVSLIASFR
jgi:hypothetical protein